MAGRNQRRFDGGPGWAARIQLWIVALAFGAAAGWWGRGVALETWGPLVEIDHVAVAGNARVDAAELVASAGLHAGLPLAALDTERISAALAAHPWVRVARVATLPTGQVILAISEREPVGFATVGAGRVFIDADGVAFAPVDEAAQVPEFLGVDGVTLGEGHPRFAQAIRILQAAAREGLPNPAQVLLGGRDETELPAVGWQRAEDGALTVILGSQDPDLGFGRLAQVWMAGLPEFRRANEVDLRFGEQLILRAAEDVGRAEDGGRAGGGDANDNDASGTAARAARPRQSRQSQEG